MRITGTYPALVTPFSADGDAIDLEALEKLVEAQLAGGVSGLVPCGTTGEAPTLSDEEQVEVIRRTVKVANKRVPVFAGTGSFSTKKSVAASKAALAAGADGVMLVMPYYNKPSQDGMLEHVVTIAKAVGAPVIIYNVPGRSVVDLTADTTERICERAPNVVAIKDATANVVRCQELKKRLGDRLTVMCGDDALTLGMMACGASGLISVTANVRPREVSEVVKLAATGEFSKARELHLKLLDLHALMFLEPNPAPAKAALATEGMLNASVRLPLLPASEATRAAIVEALKKLG
jgi:4-hydroxy-tetrahydrodipicolinate synthase